MSKEVRSQKSEVRSPFHILYLTFTFYILPFTLAYATQDITILFSGETHAMIYYCNCPVEPDGGVSRRATLIKQIRQSNPNTLVLDSGGFFAGGLMDEYTQNTELDMRRSVINLKAMELMQYDAIGIGDDEFNFGQKFLEENLANKKLNFISCNIPADKFGGKSSKLIPYMIKEVRGIKIGITAVTPLSAMQKAEGLELREPKIAVKEAVAELKNKGASIILLLSHLGENEDLRLIQDVEGIDIIVVGHSRVKEESPAKKIGQTLIVRPSWQGRRLGKLSLSIENNKITKYNVDEERLSDKIGDDQDILKILPQCFSDNNCKKEGMIGACQNPGTDEARCVFNQSAKVNLLIITPKVCRFCETNKATKYLQNYFPGLTVTYLYYPSQKPDAMIRDFGIRFLPVYLLGKEIEREKSFDNLKENLVKKGDFYMLKPEVSGVSYLVNKTKIKGKLQVCLSLYDKDTQALLDAVKEFKPTIHFLTVEINGNFDAPKGGLEVEENLRSVCVQKYYPEYFWEYISCRAKNIKTSWWEDCLGNRDAAKIRACAKSEEGVVLLRENISLNKELNIMFGPTYIWENQEIFSTQGVPTREDLKKILSE